MNYYILGIAIILIILMMGTKKREGYTLQRDLSPCKAEERITTPEECMKAAKELETKGELKRIGGCGTLSSPWKRNNWSCTHPTHASWKTGSEAKLPAQHDWGSHTFDKGCWVYYTGPHTHINHLYFNHSSSAPAQTKKNHYHYPSICGKPSKEKGCKSIDGRYSMGDARRYTGGWALSNGEGDRTKCKALCESQPECKISGQYCKETAYPSDNRCYCKFGDGCITASPPPSGLNPNAKDLGADPPSSKKPMGLCEGDCDNDDDCKGDLICWQQNYQSPPNPQCMGDGELLTILDSNRYLNFTDFNYGHSSKLSEILNGDRFLLVVDSTATHQEYPLSNCPFAFQSTVTKGNAQGLSIGHGGATTVFQVRMGSGSCIDNDTYCGKNYVNFKHDTIEMNKRVVRKVRVIKRSNGREITVWINGKNLGTQFLPVTGNIYGGGGATWGNVWGWRFKGTVHSIKLYKGGGRDHDYCVKSKTGDLIDVTVGKASDTSAGKKWDGQMKTVNLPVPCMSFSLDPNKKTNQQYPTSVKNEQNPGWGDRFQLDVQDRKLEIRRLDSPNNGWGQDLVLVGRDDGKGCSPGTTEKGPCKEDDGYDHGGADITKFQNIASSGDCCDKCKANPDCKSWTWGKVNGPWSKSCWIKNKLFGSSGKRTRKAGLISGQPPPRPPPIPPVKSGRVANPECVRYNWGEWSPCTRMCAGGTQTRIRGNNGFCIEGGKVVYFDSEKRVCNTQECPRGPTGQQGERGMKGPRGPIGEKGPTGKSGGGTGFPGSSGVVGGVGGKGQMGLTGPKGERGFRGEEGKVVSKAQVNNQLLSGIYEELLKIGGVGKEDYSNRLEPFNNPNYE